MPEQGSTVCPDCGAAYQCSSEQAGKLLHCRCGRYLVAGGNNHKTVKAAQVGSAVKTAASVAAQPDAVAAKASKTQMTSSPLPPGQQAPEKFKRYFLGTILAAFAIGGAVLFFRPMTAVKASKPAAVDTPAPRTTAFSPCSTVPARLENGTVVSKPLLGNGMGRLEIENVMPNDVVVRVVGSANLTVAWIYVQQGEKIILDSIPLGSHRVLIASGSDWDPRRLTFKCDDAYATLEKPLEYTDRREEDRTTYSAYRLVLGKQRTSMISKEDFFIGDVSSRQ